jgi:hypothetical protein
MNRDAAFEYELARWLEEGPVEAPPATIAAALAHVRAHPQRPRTLGNLWRHAMSGIGLTHVPSQPHRAWLAAGVVVAGLAIVVVGGYGLFNVGGQSGTIGGPTPTPTLRPTAKPTPTLGPGMATGFQTCTTSTPAVRTTVDEIVQDRGEILDCTHTSSDARLEGQGTVSWNSDESPDGLSLIWGAIELRNDGGTWSGTWAATSRSDALYMEFDAVWIGAGGYAGLEALNHIRVTTPELVTITSRVFQAGPVVTGTERCTTTSTGRSFAAGEVTAYRDVSLRCADTMADTRFSGTRTLRLSIDERADKSAAVWGTTVLENDEGAWEGFLFGAVEPGYTTHRVQTLMRGTGAYEGLFFRLEVVGDGTDFDLTGEVISAG